MLSALSHKTQSTLSNGAGVVKPLPSLPNSVGGVKPLPSVPSKALPMPPSRKLTKLSDLPEGAFDAAMNESERPETLRHCETLIRKWTESNEGAAQYRQALEKVRGLKIFTDEAKAKGTVSGLAARALGAGEFLKFTFARQNGECYHGFSAANPPMALLASIYAIGVNKDRARDNKVSLARVYAIVSDMPAENRIEQVLNTIPGLQIQLSVKSEVSVTKKKGLRSLLPSF